MASTQANGSLGRSSSPKGIQARLDQRVTRHEATVQSLRKLNDKTVKGFRKPGSRNTRKAGR